MGFTYQFGANPAIDFPRMLVWDTNEFEADGVTRAYIFDDREITAFTVMVQNIYISGQRSTPPDAGAGVIIRQDYYRIASLLLRALASNMARLSSIIKLLDVSLSPKEAATALKAQADDYLDLSDSDGSWAMIEQTPTVWARQDRFWNQVSRLGGV